MKNLDWQSELSTRSRNIKIGIGLRTCPRTGEQKWECYTICKIVVKGRFEMLNVQAQREGIAGEIDAHLEAVAALWREFRRLDGEASDVAFRGALARCDLPGGLRDRKNG